MTRKKILMAVASLVLIAVMIFTASPMATVISNALTQGQTSTYTHYHIKNSWLRGFTFTDEREKILHQFPSDL